MNLWVKADPINPATYAQDVAARRRRLMGRPQREPEVMSASTEAPAPKRQTIVEVRPPADAHVVAWERWKRNMSVGCKEYIALRCREMHVPIEKVVGPCQDDEAVFHRDQIIFEIRSQLKPTRSWSQIGHFFGRDHSSAIAAYRRGAARNGCEEAQAHVDLKHQRSLEACKRAKARRA